MSETLKELSKEKSDTGNYQEFVEVRPWYRFLARILDYIIFVCLTFILAGSLLSIHLEGLQAFLFYLAAIFTWIFIEALLLSTLGTTPGKWFFNVTVRNSEGNKLEFTQALIRSISIWVIGIGLGIPVICLFGLINQYNSLTKFKAAAWDKKRNHRVDYAYLHPLKTTIAVGIFTAFFFIVIFIPQLESVFKNGINITDQSGDSFSSGLLSSSLNYSSKGYALMEKGEYKKAKEAFVKGLEANPDNSTRDTLLNNLSWACYELEEYDEALSYSNRSMAIGVDNSVEYANYANALYALGDSSGAEKAYLKAIKLDENSSFSYYGLGMIQYDHYQYDKAIEQFKKYTELKKDDAEGFYYLGLSYLYGDKSMIKAKENLDKAIKMSPENIMIINGMASYYNNAGEQENAQKLYDKALADNPGNYELLCDVASYYQNDDKYDEAIKYADLAINADVKKSEAYRINAQTFFWQDEKEKAIAVISRMLEMIPEDADTYYVAGNLYNNQYEYKLAIAAFENALRINPLHENSAIGKIRALYYSKHYTACQSFAKEMEGKFNNKDIPWYIGDVYSSLQNSEKALDSYKKALSMDETNLDLITSIGWEYYYAEDFNSAAAYAEKALKIDDSNNNAKELKKSIKKRQSNIIDQVSEFIEDNYMYYKSGTSYDSVKNSIQSSKSDSIEDVKKLFDAVHKESDIFSFFLSGKDYEQYLEYKAGGTVEHESMQGGIEYIHISNFSRSTSNEFLDIVDNIENTKDKYLVIDLRGNGGGDTTSGCDILDFLLPDSVVCNLIDKDGYSNPYYSDDAFIEFKHFFILTDEESASCSELVTLGLKTYLDNVTVVGRKTFGKGVGQVLFEDKTRGFVIFLVNHYWNVREENIMDKGIEPDIKVAGSTLDAYMKEVYKQTGVQ